MRNLALIFALTIAALFTATNATASRLDIYSAAGHKHYEGEMLFIDGDTFHTNVGFSADSVEDVTSMVQLPAPAVLSRVKPTTDKKAPVKTETEQNTKPESPDSLPPFGYAVAIGSNTGVPEYTSVECLKLSEVYMGGDFHLELLCL